MAAFEIPPVVRTAPSWLQTERPLELEASDLTPCVHCGCAFNVHKGGKPGDPPETRRKCPPIVRRGLPQRFPRTTWQEDKSGDYTDYDRRLATYWGGATVFRSQCGDCCLRSCTVCTIRGFRDYSPL